MSPAEGLQGASPDATCTCPSGGGSLRHPCPAHPAVEQAGGDERDFQAEGAQEVPSPVSQEYDRHLISLLRKGEALPGHQEEAADEIERLRDWNDHLNNTVLPNILNPNFLMLMKGGERLLDLCTKDGKFIGVSLNDMKDVFDWMVTHARIAPDHAALAQPSPASDLDPLNLAPHAEAFNEAPAEALKPEPAEADRPEVVAWQYRVTAGPQTGWSLWHPGKGEEFERSYTVERRPLMTVAQHARIVGVLRAEIAEWQEAAGRSRSDVVAYIAERAKLLEERDAALVEVERLRESKGDPVGSLEKCMKVMYERDEHAKRLEVAQARIAELERQEPVALANRGLHAFWVKWTEAAAGLYGPGIKLYAAPVAQAQQLNDLDKQCRDDVARALGLRPNQERGFAWSYLLASIKSCVKASGDSAQAQHSAGYAEARQCVNCRHIGINDAAADYAACHDCRWTGPEPDEDKCPGCAGENCMAAACPECGGRYELVAEAKISTPAAQAGQMPQAWLDVQAERRRQITAEGWTPEHDDEHSHGQIARAAACYALAGSSAPNDGTAALLVSLAWPWDEQWWKPSTARRDMVKACALGLAEIERLDRAAPGKEVGHE
ncbi:hypothetical protein GUL11_26350 [Pseudomonas aeruginosa]|nr:hypothetical protein [Pseudomonas aeruginosa]